MVWGLCFSSCHLTCRCVLTRLLLRYTRNFALVSIHYPVACQLYHFAYYNLTIFFYFMQFYKVNIIPICNVLLVSTYFTFSFSVHARKCILGNVLFLDDGVCHLFIVYTQLLKLIVQSIV